MSLYGIEFLSHKAKTNNRATAIRPDNNKKNEKNLQTYTKKLFMALNFNFFVIRGPFDKGVQQRTNMSEIYNYCISVSILVKKKPDTDKTIRFY